MAGIPVPPREIAPQEGGFVSADETASDEEAMMSQDEGQADEEPEEGAVERKVCGFIGNAVWITI